MPTLKEIKGRIASVRSTLKITSAMKLVASAKLRKAQKAIEAMRPYEEALNEILAMASAGNVAVPYLNDARNAGRIIVAISSNSSLCGGFNANVIAKVKEVRKPGDVVYSIGRKMADAMRRDGFPSPQDLSAIAEHPAYSPCAKLVEKFMAYFDAGRIGEVVMVYNHFVSTAKQVPVAEQLLPIGSGAEAEDSPKGASALFSAPGGESSASVYADRDVIMEPSAKELMEAILPKTLKLKLYAALLDSQAAEHAARTVAMQTATDNGENLLQELTMQYNKGRQQKITNEILDLAGGQAS